MSSIPREDRIPLLWAALVGATAGVWAIASLWLPYGWDQGCFGYVANTMIHGGALYRDALDFKGPLTFYVYAALQFVFGRQMWAVRALDLLLLAASGIAGARIVSQFIGKTAAACTMLMVILAFASFGNWYTAQPDGWAALTLIVVASLLTQPRSPSLRDAAMSGALLGACALLKPVYGIYLFLVICASWPVDRASLLRAGQRAAIAFAAFLVPIGATIGWFALRGGVGELYDVYVRFNVERIATDPHMQMSFARTLQVTIGVPTGEPTLLLALPPAVLGAAYMFRERPRVAGVVVAWAILSLCLIGIQRKFLIHNYSWHPLYPPLGILSGIGLGRLWTSQPEGARAPRFMVAIYALLLFRFVSHEPVDQVKKWVKYARGRVTLEGYRASFDVNAYGGAAADFGFSVARDFRIADFLRAESGAADEVMVWGDPLVNYLADRPAPTPIPVPYAFTTWGAEARRERYRAALLARMTSPRASYFGAGVRGLAARGGRDQYPRALPRARRNAGRPLRPCRVHRRRSDFQTQGRNLSPPARMARFGGRVGIPVMVFLFREAHGRFPLPQHDRLVRLVRALRSS